MQYIVGLIDEYWKISASDASNRRAELSEVL
jgi:hypothetical protein